MAYMSKPEENGFKLPPLILHPFSAPEEVMMLAESARAGLILEGCLPVQAVPQRELERHLLRGRFAELRMLFYVGKDLCRWMEQCIEVTGARAQFAQLGLGPQTFATLLVEETPANVRRKLEMWGVLDYGSLFRRAIGLHSVFEELPPAECLNADFLRRYHRHADGWFEFWRQGCRLPAVNWEDFPFDLYASGEYSMLLERSWGEQSDGAPESA
jgi:hypothetical protein